LIWSWTTPSCDCREATVAFWVVTESLLTFFCASRLRSVGCASVTCLSRQRGFQTGDDLRLLLDLGRNTCLSPRYRDHLRGLTGFVREPDPTPP
jgi:hypothetical protein